MATAIIHKTDAIYSVADYAGLVLTLTQKMLSSGMPVNEIGSDDSLQVLGAAKSQRKFDVCSLAYERSKNNLLDAIALVRAIDFRDIPFFLSHEALLAVRKRLVAGQKLSARAQDMLARSNHQVFIHNVEDLIDRASNHNFDSTQSKRGYSGDRVDLIVKLKSVIADYQNASRAMGMALPTETNADLAMAMTQKMREDRERQNLKDALKIAGWSVVKIEAKFDTECLRAATAKSGAGKEVVYIVVQDGKLMLQSDRLRLNLAGRAIRGNAPKNKDFSILGKIYASELALYGTNLIIAIDHGNMILRAGDNKDSDRRVVIMSDSARSSERRAAVILS